MKKTLGMKIAELRKEHGMTQAELADKMGVTDKAVSKWERDLSCPDVSSLPDLADILDISIDELMRINGQSPTPEKNASGLMPLIFKAVAAGMGIAVVVLSILDVMDAKTGTTMLGIGLTCLALSALGRGDEYRSGQ